MPFVENDDMIKALAADRTDQTFHVWVPPRRPWRDEQFLDVHVPDATLKRPTVDPIAIANQEARRFVERKRFDDLPGGPFSRRMSCDIEVDDLAPVVTKHHEGKEYTERRSWNGE